MTKYIQHEGNFHFNPTEFEINFGNKLSAYQINCGREHLINRKSEKTIPSFLPGNFSAVINRDPTCSIEGSVVKYEFADADVSIKFTQSRDTLHISSVTSMPPEMHFGSYNSNSSSVLKSVIETALKCNINTITASTNINDILLDQVGFVQNKYVLTSVN